MQIVFQLRHAIVHNAAVLTKTDARKLQLLTRRKVDAPRVLRPSRADVWYVKLFLDEAAERIDEEVSSRLIELLGTLHSADHSLFGLADKAQELANAFGRTVTLGVETRSPS